ncbi:adenylate/guanylate cyclase domain-containing protein [Aliishimia ponticola]|uniref:Adenylate/guanylate cyclase domain-containing protein n=1 Tax=Aliishimia ponticola TaxID=2499833 RepID=A0A4S4NAC8_9RHOB|nr:adenylate/guanylate cyclase domain-containing protein [Aliishimia ponticola]THH36262.1 adenylate/guanylate cyclase domain-containing protein [Aliishimia ponticola]
MAGLWGGTWTTRTRIATGLVLFTYVGLHFLNIASVLISPQFADRMMAIMTTIVRSLPGTLLLYGALGLHAALALGKVAFSKRLQLSATDMIQVGFGVTIPLILASHVTFTRLSYEQYATNVTVSYIAGLIWDTRDGWLQAILLLLTWLHGCLGVHMWLRQLPWWRRYLSGFAIVAALVPAFALSGLISEGRRASALWRGAEAAQRDAFFEATNWPAREQFSAMLTQSRILFWTVAALICLTAVIYVVRQILSPRRSLRISYVNGPTISTAPGPTLLEMSQIAGVPHTSLCGGKGRCTTCRVILQDGREHVAPPSAAETAALRAVDAPEHARLACQIRPTGPCTVYRMFEPEARRRQARTSQGKEARLAILFLDMRGFTARTTGHLPYDVVFLLNRFFDAIVPEIIAAGGTVDKYLGDGLLAVFELPASEASAQAGVKAARGIGVALERFNAQLRAEGSEPVRIGLSLHLGTLVLGEIGAAGLAPRTLIGDTVNAASRLEAETKQLGVEGLISLPVLEAAGIPADPDTLIDLALRGVAEPVTALKVPVLAGLPEL